jgi:hypothetical protein
MIVFKFMEVMDTLTSTLVEEYLEMQRFTILEVVLVKSDNGLLEENY